MVDFLQRISWVWVLIAWTFFLWISRLRNVVNNDDLTSGGRVIRVAVVVIFVAFAAAAAVAVRRNQPNQRRVLALFLAWTIGYWLIRGVGILIDSGYSVGFKAVHTVLMVVSLSLSALTVRQLRS